MERKKEGKETTVGRRKDFGQGKTIKNSRKRSLNDLEVRDYMKNLR